MDHYEKARRRVRSSKKLAPFREFILDDWPEGDKHYAWVARASVREILDWVNQTGEHRLP